MDLKEYVEIEEHEQDGVPYVIVTTGNIVKASSAYLTYEEARELAMMILEITGDRQ